MKAVERVNKAMDILAAIKASDLKIESRILCSPLYQKTALQRKEDVSTLTTQGTDEVVRKNLYYLAEQIKNIQKLLIQLVQKGFLNLSEREIIVKHEDDFLKAVEMLSFIIKKDPNRFKLLLEIFQETGNELIPDLINQAAANGTEIRNEEVASGNSSKCVAGSATPAFTSPPRPQLERKNTAKPWNCPHCTFKNDQGNICSMCSRSNMATLISHSFVGKVCGTCTMKNPADALQCVACENDLDAVVIPV